MKKKQELELWNKTDVKIFILFLLDNLNYPLDLATIDRIIVETGYVRPFDFTECFSELLEVGQVLEDDLGGERVYQISSVGRMVAGELQSEILDTIRRESSLCAARLLSLHRRGATLSTDIEEREDGKLLVRLSITDRDGVMLETVCAVPSRRQAEQICLNFERKPEKSYRGILSVLTGEVDYLLS